jgi:pimeloyl-ACP methyl ester carboxylesterase
MTTTGSVHTGSVHSEGADIVYDYQGTGPLLLMISGGGGDAERYALISAILAEEYTTVSYDRRGNSRSTGDAPSTWIWRSRHATRSR